MLDKFTKTFKSELTHYFNKEDNKFYLDARRLYKDIENWTEREKLKRGELENEDGSPLLKLDRGHPLQHILNSTSAQYIAPTSMKSFNTCPASYLYNKCIPRKSGTATSIGNTFHDIMERYYNLEGKERNNENLEIIIKEKLIEDENEDSEEDIRNYVKGYFSANDYLTGKPMNHQELECSTETFIRTDVLKPLGVDIGVSAYNLIDRIDIRENGIYLIDYKTGWGDPRDYNLGRHGYLPQMIFYKWAVEQEYGQEVKGVYLCLPGASDEYKYVEMNVNSLVEQSILIENSLEYLEYARNIRDTKQFPLNYEMLFSNPYLKQLCREYEGKETIIPIEIDMNEFIKDLLEEEIIIEGEDSL